MTERERLIELIFHYQVEITAYEASCGRSTRAVSERLADYLLASGVIVPSVKVCEKRIDDLGRIHIPKDVRQPLGINYGNVMSIIVSDASIILRKEREQK